MKRLLYAALMVAALAACTSPGTDVAANDTATTTETSTTTTETVAAETQIVPPPAAQEEKPMSAYENKVAELKTTAGEIHLRFFPDVAPGHVKNFIDLAQQGFYNGTKFHRVIPGFMIQGGDPNTIKGDPGSWGMGGSPNKLKAEFNTVSHKRGILSAARSNHPDSASSQFFIVVADSTFLDRNYTVFGQVTKGMDIADAIVGAPTQGERPVNPVSITSITIRDARPDEQGPAPK